MTDALNPERFHDLVSAYGADPDRWPADLRRAAIHCLVDSEVARATWRDAAELDDALDSVAAKEVSGDLVDRVFAIADPTQTDRSAMVPGWWRQALPYAAAAAIALVVGLSVPSPLRDAGDAPIQTAILDVETTPASESGLELTALALVDSNSFADSDTSEEDDFIPDNLLSDLPLL